MQKHLRDTVRPDLLAALVHGRGARETVGPERCRLGVFVDRDDAELDRAQVLCSPKRAVLVCARSYTTNSD